MKKLMFLMLFACTAVLCQAQYTLNVKNNTPHQLDIGGEMVYMTAAVCAPDPGAIVTFGLPAIAPGETASFFIPSGYVVYKLGGSRVGGPQFGWDLGGSPCWPSGACGAYGSYSVTYGACDDAIIE